MVQPSVWRATCKEVLSKDIEDNANDVLKTSYALYMKAYKHYIKIIRNIILILGTLKIIYFPALMQDRPFMLT